MRKRSTTSVPRPLASGVALLITILLVSVGCVTRTSHNQIVGDLEQERDLLKKKLESASVPKILIERADETALRAEPHEL